MNKFFLIFLFAALFMATVFAVEEKPETSQEEADELSKLFNDNPRLKELFDKLENTQDDEAESQKIFAEILQMLNLSADMPEAEDQKDSEKDREL